MAHLFNEPGIYTKFPYEKIRDLLKNHVGPLLAREGVRTKLQLSEAPDRADAHRNYPKVLDDPEARKTACACREAQDFTWTVPGPSPRYHPGPRHDVFLEEIFELDRGLELCEMKGKLSFMVS